MSRNPQQPGFRGQGTLGPGGGRATPSRGATVHRQGKFERSYHSLNNLFANLKC
jgi:hypothetical protein